MVAAGLVGTPFPESTRPYAKITDHYGRWREGGPICGGICVLYTYDVCLREETQPGVVRGGKQIGRTLRSISVCFENVPQMRYFALCVLNMLDVCFRNPPNGGDGGRGRTKNTTNTVSCPLVF